MGPLALALQSSAGSSGAVVGGDVRNQEWSIAGWSCNAAGTTASETTLVLPQSSRARF